MWRTRAVLAMLAEDVAGLRRPGERGQQDEGDGLTGATELEALAQARRRAVLVVGVDLMAVAVLFLARDHGAPFLPWAASVETVFTLGVLAVTLHAGFRLGQLEKLQAVARLCEDLAAREE